MSVPNKAPASRTPLKNSKRVSLVWFDGTSWAWHVYVPYAKHLTASGYAGTEQDAQTSAAKHA